MASCVSRRMFLQTAALATLTSTAGCLENSQFGLRSPPDDAWPLPRYDPAGTAHNPHASPPRTIATDWQTSTGTSAERGAFIVAEDTVVIGGRQQIVAVDSMSGAIQWRKAVGSQVLGYQDGTVFTAHENRGVSALRLDDGSLQWKEDMSNKFYDIVLTASTVLLAAYEKLLCLDIETGDLRWQVTAGGGTGPTGVSVSDGVAVHTDAGIITAYERSFIPDIVDSAPDQVWASDGLGTDKHTFNFPDAPTVADGRVYIGEGDLGAYQDAQVIAVSADDGSVLWQTDAYGYFTTTAALEDDRGYVLTKEKPPEEASVEVSNPDPVTLRALSLDTGANVWTTPLPQYHSPRSIAVADGVVLSCGDASNDRNGKGILTATQASTGDRIWQTETNRAAIGIALVGEAVYVGTRTGAVYRFGAE